MKGFLPPRHNKNILAWAIIRKDQAHGDVRHIKICKLKPQTVRPWISGHNTRYISSAMEALFYRDISFRKRFKGFVVFQRARVFFLQVCVIFFRKRSKDSNAITVSFSRSKGAFSLWSHKKIVSLAGIYCWHKRRLYFHPESVWLHSTLCPFI